YVISADSTYVNISRYCWGVGAKTLYYRIFCLMPSTANESSIVDFTENAGDDFILNTDYNYMKLVNAGVFEFGGTVKYTHNLGFVPRVRFWMENSGEIGWFITTQIISSDPDGSGGMTSGLRVTSTD